MTPRDAQTLTEHLARIEAARVRALALLALSKLVTARASRPGDNLK